MLTRPTTSPRRRALMPLLATLLSACGHQKDHPTPPPVIVDTLVVKAAEIPNIVELPGRIEAVRSAEVRARTDGIVLRRVYEEGTRVRAGAALFQLDPRDYAAQVRQSQATLARAVATRDNAAALLRRYTPLAQRRAVSGQEFDTAQADLRTAEAQVADAQAALTRSRLQLGFTTIRAPIDGVAGRAEVTEGALVSAGQATLMTRVDQTTPVYAVFTTSSSSILDSRDQVKSGTLRVPSMSAVTVRLVLENGAEYGPQGKLDFTAPVVDPATGSQLVRARFPNAERILTPGQFVRGRIVAGTIEGGITVPARAVQMKGDQASVSIVGKDGAVVSRPVTLGQLLGQRWIVRSGLKAGDRLIVEGWQKARPGQKVRVRDAATGPEA